MPELVEVKISSEIVNSIIQHKTISNVEIYPNSKYRNELPVGFQQFLLSLKDNVKVENIETKGKLMYWTFSNNWYMLCGFGMSGQWSTTQGKHPCISITYLDNEEKKIYFNDPRHFGTIKFVNKQELMNKLDNLGWDPLAQTIDESILKFITSKLNNKPIGQLLLDQSIFAGVGNYIRAEALYLAKLSPWRIGNSLSEKEISTLCDSLVIIVKDSYNHQGATIHTYKDSYGNNGKYSNCFKVYGKKIDSFGNLIKKEITPEGRTIHWSPDIQK